MPSKFAGYPKKMMSGPEGTKAPSIKENDDVMYRGYYANMPTEEIMKEYPKGAYGINSYYNDNIYGIDKFAEQNEKQIMKQINDPYRGR